jgi:hypothetical protein
MSNRNNELGVLGTAPTSHLRDQAAIATKTAEDAED